MAGVATPPRWLADEMLGRLARYLRILGYDTEYIRGWGEPTILAHLSADPRILLTRNRSLGARAPQAIVLVSTDLPDQLRELIRAFGPIPSEPRFDRCTLCNAPLVEQRRSELATSMKAPLRIPEQVWVCSQCRHVYWEGGHTARLREELARWIGPEAT
jgi:uncharacterized protein with PIN domain